MGSDQFSLPILRALLGAGPDVQVAGVVTRPDRPAGRGRRLAETPVKGAAREAGVPVLQPERVRRAESVQEILALSPDVIVVASFGQILPEPLLNEPPYRCLNLHPSLLPRYRGPSPVQGAILAGDGITGTSLMVVTAQMDAGPILDQEEVAIAPHETAGELEARLAVLSAEMLLRDLRPWCAGDLKPVPQRDDDATYTSLVRKEDGNIDWRQPAYEIERRVRAFNPWPVAYTAWEGRLIRVLRAGAVDGRDEPGRVRWDHANGLLVGTGGGLLHLDEVQISGGKPLPGAAFVRGHRSIEGAVLGTW